MAEGEGGAGRAWTKGAVAQKGHARHAEPRRNFAFCKTNFEPCHREGISSPHLVIAWAESPWRSTVHP
jgi:hypothetical protein